jgi:hypothetical protein
MKTATIPSHEIEQWEAIRIYRANIKLIKYYGVSRRGIPNPAKDRLIADNAQLKQEYNL